MVACVERRFGARRHTASGRMAVRQRLGLHRQGDAQTATALGLRLAFTPVRSPESNGIAEAFVKTLKRDYARLTILPDARDRNAAFCRPGSRTTTPFTRTQACAFSLPESSAAAVLNPPSCLSGQTGCTPVMEMKNVRSIGRDHINQLNRYLVNEFGAFGVLVTRNPLTKPMFKNTVELWSGQRRCIIALTDADLELMVEVLDSKQRLPIEVLKKKYIEFRRSCPS